LAAVGGGLVPAIQKPDLGAKSDEELMCLWVDSRQRGHGSTAAFDLLWERHHSPVYRLVTRVLGPHRSLADEIFQDTWLEVIGTTRYVPGSFRAYIRTLATRNAVDRLTSAAIRMVHAAEERESSEQPAVPDPGGVVNPIAKTEAREGTRLVLEIADGMPPLQRAAWVLRYVEQMTYEEVAEAMDTKLGTAKTRVRLANEFLARTLQDRGIDPTDLEGEP
jgi:RNA polymerase sigma-70 factor (ECF subfamily)